MSIAENVASVRERIEAAAHAANRDPREIQLMAVSKTVSTERIFEAYDAGIRVFGENRVQEFESKAGGLAGLAEIEWHMIGHLQSNKASRAAELFDAVDSVDSLKLTRRLNLAAQQSGKTLPVLIEINIGDEQVKSGVAPQSKELDEILHAAPELSFLQFRGLMAVPPYDDNPEQSRPYFQRMKVLFEEIRVRNLPNVRVEVLSMGMSHDFEVAIQEGSTCVRIGTSIFGERPAPRSES